MEKIVLNIHIRQWGGCVGFEVDKEFNSMSEVITFVKNWTPDTKYPYMVIFSVDDDAKRIPVAIKYFDWKKEVGTKWFITLQEYEEHRVTPLNYREYRNFVERYDVEVSK